MQSNDNVIILGDFNMPDIRWPSLSADSNFQLYFVTWSFNPVNRTANSLTWEHLGSNYNQLQRPNY